MYKYFTKMNMIFLFTVSNLLDLIINYVYVLSFNAISIFSCPHRTIKSSTNQEITSFHFSRLQKLVPFSDFCPIFSKRYEK